MSGAQNAGLVSNNIRNQRLTPTSGSQQPTREAFDNAPTPRVRSAPTVLEKTASFASQFGSVIALSVALAGGISGFYIFQKDLDSIKSDLESTQNMVEVNKTEIDDLDTARQLADRDTRQINDELQRLYKITHQQSEDISEISKAQIELKYSK